MRPNRRFLAPLLVCLWLACAAWMPAKPAASATLAAPAQAWLPLPPKIEFVQHPGQRLPLRAAFVDETGRAVRLGDFFDGARPMPVVIVPGYFHCTNLCSTVMEGVLQAFSAIALPPGSYRLLAISIDPRDTAAVAAAKKSVYENMLGGGGHAHISLLTGQAEAIAAVMQSIGFEYVYDAAQGQYAHPAGFLIATPDGRISKYFMGVRFDRAAVAQALTAASGGGVGGLADRLLLLCTHYNPLTGRYSMTVMAWMRIVCGALLALLAGWIWRHRNWNPPRGRP